MPNAALVYHAEAAHSAGRALCGRMVAGARGIHLFGALVSCNRCQRAAWQAEQKKRFPHGRPKRRGLRPRRFAVPANPVRWTRAGRDFAHAGKMIAKGYRR